MKLCEILEFRKDLYFEGAVQADWFYSQEKASKVAENFVFHGRQYFGIDDLGLGNKKRIDTISFVEELVRKLDDDKSNALSLAIADYGTGKSHLAVTLAQLFSGAKYMPETYSKILRNIENIDKEAAENIKNLTQGNNFVMVLNGMRDFNLHSEILKAAQRSLKLYGLSDECLRKLNRAIETAEIFFDRNAKSNLDKFEKAALNQGLSLKGERLLSYIKQNLMTEETAFEIVNEVYQEINGQEIHWDEGLSASSILERLISELCGMNGAFDHVIILFDEFGRYLEYTAGVNAAKSGESGLQQIFELTQKTQNVDGYLHVINFIQRDIKAYLETVDQTKNVSRYIGRFDQSDKYYISSNLETVFANLIQRKDKDIFDDIVVKWQQENEKEWKTIYEKMSKWLPLKGIWKNYTLFRKVCVEGIYPLHPISTYMLTNLSDYLQNRSSLTLVSNYINEFGNYEMQDKPLLIMPQQLLDGDLYIEILSAEQEGRQKTQQCIKYDNILRKFSDRLSNSSLIILRANLICRLLRFRTNTYEEAIDSLSLCSGLSVNEVKAELKWLVDEYAVLEFDEHAGFFDFTEESNGAHDFKIIKKRLMANASVSKTELQNVKIQELAGVYEIQNTNFGIQRKITTNEWCFIQEMYPIEDFSMAKVNDYLDKWRGSINSVSPKGRLIWLYVNRDTDSSAVERAQKLIKLLDNKPIIVMLLNDVDNRMYNSLVEYILLDRMDDAIRKKYERHYTEDFVRAEKVLREEIESLKKQRQILNSDGITRLNLRMSIYLTSVFEKVYPRAIPFFFDGFVTKGNNISTKAAGYYCSFLRSLLTNSINSHTINNLVIDMRNRMEALFFISSGTSWKCINEQFSLMPPEEPRAKFVYDDIIEQLNREKELSCEAIYEKYSMPPFGLSEEIITLMIAVICANLNFCLRMRCPDIVNLNVWTDKVITNNDKKIDLKFVKESTIVLVDAGAVSGKYMRLFDEINNNHDINEVNRLIAKLEDLKRTDEVPAELETRCLLAEKTLEEGVTVKRNWESNIIEISKKYDEAYAEKNIYNALVALDKLNKLPIDLIFTGAYIFDDESKDFVRNVYDDIKQFIEDNFERYMDRMYCSSVEGVNSFRNHNTKVENYLRDLGFSSFADKVKKRKETELANIEEIKSRQDIRSDYEKYIAIPLNEYSSYVGICNYLKEGLELQKRVEKYKYHLGKDADEIDSKIKAKIKVLEQHKKHVSEAMDSIWNDLYEVENVKNIENLILRINTVLQKGISEADQNDFSELKDDLQGLLNDISKLQEASYSRELFEEYSDEMLAKYEDSELDFDVIPIIENLINELQARIDMKEQDWIKQNLSLGDKSRNSIHRWKARINVLPEFLSAQTLKQIDLMQVEADNILRNAQIDDVVFYFEKLPKEDKKLCLNKLMSLMNK